ncbi:MAG: hypothetical protein OXQ28_08270 [Acidobacteriota bacterium]|nr:hypothetical protein [Acidobacteriota bacterium]
MTGWIIPLSDRKRPQVRVCAACERRDPYMTRIEDRDAGVHAAHWRRWRRTEIDACDHPEHPRGRR